MTHSFQRRILGALLLVGALATTQGCKKSPPKSATEQAYDEAMHDKTKRALCKDLEMYACMSKLAQVDSDNKQAAAAGLEQARLNSLPHGDPNVPDSSYSRITSGYQIATMYYALSGLPPDYEALSSAASEEYRSNSDEFRKRDLIQALRPKIDNDIARYKDPNNRYVIWEEDGVRLQHYDFKTSSFPVSLNVDGYDYFPDASKYTLSFNNGEKFLRLPIADQARAHEIESLVTKGQTWGSKAMYYAFAQEADPAHNSVNVQILRVVLQDQKHGEIARY